MEIGVSLTGGGARGAYQAGVLKGLAEIFKSLNLSSTYPIKQYSGVSAGAINATYLAASREDFGKATEDLCHLWGALSPDKVYKTDAYTMGKIGLGWMRDLTMGAAFEKKRASELLDRTPLEKLIKENIAFENIQTNIEEQRLNGVACTAYNYNSKKTVSFVQGNNSLQHWVRPKRYSDITKLTPAHVLASSAIPIIFEPVKINDIYFGDGTLRNSAPISPTIHLGAKKLIVIGVRYANDSITPIHPVSKPSIAEILGTLLNGLFFDTTDIDLERLESINKSIEYCGDKSKTIDFKKISYISFHPSTDIANLALDLAPKYMPSIVDYLLRGLGSRNEYAELASYLLFDSSFTKKLIELGYEDTMKKRGEFSVFLES